ncbi:MAG: hypothetical protein AAF591_16160 [Verrucomicrobiota bacterium]
MTGGQSESRARGTLVSFNTVERLLRGDFFHTVHWEEVLGELGRFPAEWGLAGVGTTNWFGRNGEAIIHGTVGAPEVYWSDPRKADPMHVIDLLREHPSGEGKELVSPSLDDDEGEEPAFPFFALGVCDPSVEVEWAVPAGVNLHEWLLGRFHEENIGLAAIAVEGAMGHVEYASAFYLPLEGIDLDDLYHADDNFRLASHEGGRWIGRGVYAANPTLQRIISVEGLPLHLHGWEEALRIGGHVSRATVGEGVSVRVWVLRDFLLEIRNLERERVKTRVVE